MQVDWGMWGQTGVWLDRGYMGTGWPMAGLGYAGADRHTADLVCTGLGQCMTDRGAQCQASR